MRLLPRHRFTVVLLDVLLAGGGTVTDVECDLRQGEVTVSGRVVTDPYAPVSPGCPVLVRNVPIARHPYRPRWSSRPAGLARRRCARARRARPRGR